MSLLHTSSTLRRLFLGPGPLYRPCVPAHRRVEGVSHCQTTKTRPPWAHQSRFSSSDPQGNGQDDDPYKILGVPTDAPQSEIKKAYYAQAKKLHPDASKRITTLKFHELQDAYDKISTPEARKKHDDEVRERQKAAQKAQDAATTTRPVHSKEKSGKSDISSVGNARFVKRETLEWMRKIKEEADAQREKDLAAQRTRDMIARKEKEQREREEADAQRERDLAAQRTRDMIARKEKEQREREATPRYRDRQEAPAQRKAGNGDTASHERKEPRSEPKSGPKSDPKSEPREVPGNESSPRDKAGRAECDENKRGAASARRPTVNPESLRVAILRLSPGTTIPDVVERLASCAVGSVVEIQVTESGTARIDFSTADAARKLQHLIRGEKFTISGKKVKVMALQASVLPVPQDPLASRVLILTDRHGKLPMLDSQHVKFIMRQNGHVCPWVEINRLSRTKTALHFGSWREAEKASPILQDHFPGVHVMYGIDPATGDKDAIPTGKVLQRTRFQRFIRDFILWFGSYLTIVAFVNFFWK